MLIVATSSESQAVFRSLYTVQDHHTPTREADFRERQLLEGEWCNRSSLVRLKSMPIDVNTLDIHAAVATEARHLPAQAG